jgi:hypothetical protein
LNQKVIAMRRLMRAFVVAGVLGTLVMGCRHVTGVCDCDHLDPCCLRAPWANESLNGIHPALYNGFGTAPVRQEPPEALPKPTEKR